MLLKITGFFFQIIATATFCQHTPTPTPLTTSPPTSNQSTLVLRLAPPTPWTSTQARWTNTPPTPPTRPTQNPPAHIQLTTNNSHLHGILTPVIHLNPTNSIQLSRHLHTSTLLLHNQCMGQCLMDSLCHIRLHLPTTNQHHPAPTNQQNKVHINLNMSSQSPNSKS